MTLFTLQRNGKARGLKKTAWAYGILAVFCGVFSIVYLQFSHGESSPFLTWLFAPALVLGMLPAILLSGVKPIQRPNIRARRLWNSAIATLSAGMLVRAIINISGRYTEYDMIYWILAGLLFFAAAAVYIRRTIAMRKTAEAI